MAKVQMTIAASFVLLLFAENIVTVSPLLFANQPANVYTFETDENGNKQDLILPCSIDNPSPTVSYTWFRGDQELPGSMVNGEGSLIVPNITEGVYASREGVDYYCIARDNIGFDVAVRSRTITVYYAYFDGFERMSSTIEVAVPVALNSDVALECDVLAANPPPKIKWFNDMGEIQEARQGNNVRFLDNGHFLYLRSLQSAHLEQQYYCAVANINLTQEISAPTRYVLTNNLTRGVLVDYKQIGSLTAFVGNTSFEFSYVGGVFGDNVNGTANRLFVNNTPVDVLGNIGSIEHVSSPGYFILKADVNYNGIITRRNGNLTVYQVPRITKKSSLQNMKRTHYIGEENLFYTCEFEGFPFPNIVFYFNGAPIIADGTRGVNIVNDTLIIPTPQVSHSGIYQCIVSNEFVDDQQTWLLEVREPILPQVQPYNFTNLDAFDDRDLGALFVRPNGSALSFSIDVVADPCPSIEWSFNGLHLTSNDIITFNNPCVEESTNRKSNLTWTFLLNVTITQATSGSYSAILNNTAGLVHLPRVYFTIPAPVSIIDLTLNETCLKEGSNAAICCNIQGFPRPTIQFQLDDQTVIPGATEFENYVLEYYNQIAITNITMRAGGRYICLATRTSGPPLQVTQSFEFCTEPIITDVSFTSDPHIGESLFLECTFNGTPTPRVIWSKDGAELNEMDINIKIVPTESSSRLEITEAKSKNFNGMYVCNISNPAGFTFQVFAIKLKGVLLPPGEIVGIVVALISAISIVLIVILCFSYCLRRREQQGKQEGFQEGVEIGKQKGLQEGEQKGLKEGLERGKQEGLKEGVQKGIRIGQDVATKFNQTKLRVKQGKISTTTTDGKSATMAVMKKSSIRTFANSTDPEEHHPNVRLLSIRKN